MTKLFYTKPVYIVGAQRSPIAKVRRGNPNTSSISQLEPKNLAAQVLNALFSEVKATRGMEFSFKLGSAISKLLEKRSMFHAPAKHFINGTLWNGANCVDASLIGEACATGLLAIQAGVKDILLNDAELVVAGGVEMMSRHSDEVISKIFLDVSTGKNMAVLSDNKALRLGFSREDQESYALSSYQKAHDHIGDHGLVKIYLPSDKENPALAQDEGPMKIPTLDMIKRLGLIPGCQITSPASASKYGDAAAFVALASSGAVAIYQLKPLGKIIGFARHSELEPEDFIIAPIGAIKKALERASLRTEDVDLFEINEAFSSTVLATMAGLNIPSEKVNLWGGAIAHGHPIGATGAALVVKNLAMLEKYNKRYGVVALCSAIGEGICCAVERV